MKQTPTWDELLATLNNAQEHTNEKAWSIYRYLAANVGDGLSSDIARQLLLTYTRLNTTRPSLLHSLFLGMALRMAKQYTDFRLPGFLAVWDLSNLRPEDEQQKTAANGTSFPSLAENLTHAILKFRLQHPEEVYDAKVLAVAGKYAPRLGYRPIQHMVAVKVFEKVVRGRKHRFVKLIGPQGDEVLADSHVMGCSPWEIQNQLFDVLIRTSKKSDSLRAVAAKLSTQDIEKHFPVTIGFVDGYDDRHGHFHIFDAQSRHFVATTPEIRPEVGTYVWFCPVIPAEDPFKSAIITRRENSIEGRQAFGLMTATVTFINKEKGFFRYQIDEERGGFGLLKLSPRPLAQGDEIRIIAFLRRGKDGEKRLHLAEIV
ncbi:MAG: hypothetical protein HUK02_02525 [Bacteroidaceae bacterium]|nr:hypothetical protein [Bacteroidaceae bacterium]